MKDIYNQGPVRHGAVYCSPWCGAKCTHASFLRAEHLAAELAKELGPMWEPRVWENLGWHWSVRTRDGRLKVHPNEYPGEETRYTAFLHDEPDSSGGRFAYSADTPRDAIKLCLKRAEQELKEASLMMSVAQLALDGMKERRK